jgi:signal transduction histidine kinase
VPDARSRPRFLPDSLLWGIFALLIGVVILMGATTVIYFLVHRNEAGIVAAASQAADQIITIKRMIERDRPEDRMRLVRRLNSPTMRMVITPMPLVTESDDKLSSRVVRRRLESEFPTGTDIRVDTRLNIATQSGNMPDAQEPTEPAEEQIEIPMAPPTDQPPANVYRDRQSGGDRAPGDGRMSPEERHMRFLRRMQSDGPQLFPTQGSFRVSVKFAENTWFNARVLLNVGDSQSQRQPFLFLGFMSLLVGVVALAGVSRAFRPLATFTGAAERLGVDVNAAPLDESGPGEVRRAAKAFNQMQLRLQRFIQDRTQMLAAISHDLRTPITRLRLRAEFIDDDVQRDKMLNDLDEMETMIAATLAFSRDEAASENMQTLNLATFLSGIVADERTANRDVIYEGPTELEATVRPVALKRAVVNLIDNAVKYGQRARVTLERFGEVAEILIDDDGPGIAEEDHERVFRPFVRLEASRSRETGGTGLGLTIARNVLRGMGGDVEIVSRAEPGLRVRITLPIKGR